MMRYLFSLHRVLRVRAAQETGARQALRAAADLVAAAEDDYDARFLQYQAAVAGAAAFRGTALNLLAAREAASRRAREVRDAENAGELARAQLAAAQSAWSAAKQRVRTLEQLHDRERARHDASVRRAEQVAADDLVSGRAARVAGTKDGIR